MKNIPIEFNAGRIMLPARVLIKYCAWCTPASKHNPNATHGICLTHANEMRAQLGLPLRVPANYENTIEGQLARDAGLVN